MTLKEKVAEIQPSEINSLVTGGVIGCPQDYPYLHESMTKSEIFGDVCGVGHCLSETGGGLNCRACWNRPYIEPEVQQDA